MSEKKYQLSLHIFRRDLRLEDNTALIAALTLSKNVIPCFIYDPRQVKDNAYKSDHSLYFMNNSLRELDAELKKKGSRLFYFAGIAENVIAKLIKQIKPEAIFINRDYTPFSIKRDLKIKSTCAKNKVDFYSFADALLHEPEEVLKADGKPYTVFTPFFRKASLLEVSNPQRNSFDNYYRGRNVMTESRLAYSISSHAVEGQTILGGRKEGLQLLKKISHLKNYQKIRNYPALNGTSKLSAHHKFGTISIRETYAHIVKSFGKSHTLVSELYWRDFFTHVAFHFPHIFKLPFHQQYKNIAWNKNKNHFKAWCEGKTRFPIVDAGMRELNTTGYMHNRVRMIVASFLVKDLHINWQWGEKYFAQQLVDYDPAVNNGNWQWAASTGCDAQPYFRIFNPWLQQKTYDPKCIYIKHYISELAKAPISIIHKWNTETKTVAHYPKPIINHNLESQKAKSIFKTYAKKRK